MSWARYSCLEAFDFVGNNSAVLRVATGVLRGLLALIRVLRFLDGGSAFLCHDLSRVILFSVGLVLLLAGKRLIFFGCFFFGYVRFNVIGLAVELLDVRTLLPGPIRGELGVDVVRGRL